MPQTEAERAQYKAAHYQANKERANTKNKAWRAADPDAVRQHGATWRARNPDSDTTPNPGSDAALDLGCRCPVMDNSHGRGYMGQADIFVMSDDCPLHAPPAARPCEVCGTGALGRCELPDDVDECPYGCSPER